MNVIVTCGPSCEPIDEVRRLTNLSSGELGVVLAQTLHRAGFTVICLKGSGATWPGPADTGPVLAFDSNADLRQRLQQLAREQPTQAVFHAAALCDFRVSRVLDKDGRECRAAKLSSQTPSLCVELEPAPKIIAELRSLFPAALLVGWKYQLDGDRIAAIALAQAQIQQHRLDACVLNGRAFGPGFALCEPGVTPHEAPDKPALAEMLSGWLQKRLDRSSTSCRSPAACRDA